MEETILLTACFIVIVEYFRETFQIGAFFLFALVWSSLHEVLKPFLKLAMDNPPEEAIQDMTVKHTLLFLGFVFMAVSFESIPIVSSIVGYFVGSIGGLILILIGRKTYEYFNKWLNA